VRYERRPVKSKSAGSNPASTASQSILRDENCNRALANPQTEKQKPVEAPLPAAEPRIEVTYNTRFLAPPHEEIGAAAHLMRQKFPELSEEMLNECLSDRLNIDSINKGTEVYVLVRKSYGRKRMTDAQSYREAPDGMRITVYAGEEALAKEIQILGPVRARDHWTEGQHAWSSELERSGFLSAIGKLAAPWAIVATDAGGKKHGELPRWYTLSYC
jgi:hypothetical protein